MLHADTLLNLAWAFVCLAAFGWLVGFERKRVACGTRALIYRAIALSLALVSLFPCVSASDDLVRLQFFSASVAPESAQGSSQPLSRHETEKKTLGTLVRLLEALESAQVAVSLVLNVVLCLFAMACIRTHKSLDRFLPIPAGRAPPAL